MEQGIDEAAPEQKLLDLADRPELTGGMDKRRRLAGPLFHTTDENRARAARKDSFLLTARFPYKTPVLISMEDRTDIIAESLLTLQLLSSPQSYY